MSVNTFSDWLLNVLDSKGWSQARAQAERAQFQITFEEAQELLDILPEWMLEDEPKIVNGLLTRLFRGIKIMGDGSVVPVLRN